MTTQRRLLTALIIALAAMALLVAGLSAARATAAPPQASQTLPRVPTELSAPAGSLRIRPGSITYTGDGTGVLSGANIRKPGLHWSSWTVQRALGTGDNQLDNCKPDCADGHFSGYPIELEAWRPSVLHGQRVFTRLTIVYTGRRPSGSSAHYTFTDLYQYGGLGFGPPDADDYCVNTSGQPPAAGCANINTLPPGS